MRVVNGVQRVEMTQNSTGEADFRKRWEAAVAREIQVIDGRVPLTDAQKKKLQL